MAALQDCVKTVVLVMMENRSFDHMLGHLSMEDPTSQVNGLKEDDKLNYDNYYNGDPFSIYQLKIDTDLETDLPHEAEYVAIQLMKSKVSDEYKMQGFVDAYAKVYGHPNQHECIPMAFFPSSLVPVSSFLAKNFCPCDNWFSPIPTSTQPNRTMAFCGYSPIFSTGGSLIPIKENIFQWMTSNKIKWRVYHDGLPFFALYESLIHYILLGENFRKYDRFEDEWKNEPAETAPQVIIVEPCYFDAPHIGGKHPNDNHAPLAVGWGEYFLKSIYQTLINNSSRWANTVMVLYYDEHGGFFDHVAPAKIPYTTTGTVPHSFESLGPRIPACIISPFVSPGLPCKELFDHTSVLQFLAELFTPSLPYSDIVESRKKYGIKSLTEALKLQNRAPAPTPPLVTSQIENDFGKAIMINDKTTLKIAFANAALQMMEKYPVETAGKFPELFDWREDPLNPYT